MSQNNRVEQKVSYKFYIFTKYIMLFPLFCNMVYYLSCYSYDKLVFTNSKKKSPLSASTIYKQLLIKHRRENALSKLKLLWFMYENIL